MKKLLLVGVMLCLAVSVASAQAVMEKAAPAATPAAAPVATAPVQLTLQGDVIDNTCASAQKPETLAAFVKTHTKACAVSCAASGYSIYADGKLSKFDAASNAKIAEFLKKDDSKLAVVVVANKVGDELSLVSIENQK